MASSLAIYYTPMHFMWGVKSGATPVETEVMTQNIKKYMNNIFDKNPVNLIVLLL